ncbi:hypothetical protein JCM11641_002450 [Rhodosporidiobolus odoratus]
MNTYAEPADAQPAPATAIPIALRLPLKVWLDILSNLSNGELHRAGMICKKMNDMVDRSYGRTPLPLIDGIRDFNPEPMQAPLDSYGMREFNAFDYINRAEYATQLACTKLMVYLHVDLFKLEDQSGITVNEVLERLSEAWTGVPAEEWTGDEAKNAQIARTYQNSGAYSLDVFPGEKDWWNG